MEEVPLSSVTALLTRISVEHIPALTVLALYCVGKLAARGAFGGPGWDPICLCHNVLSVALGGYSLWHWGDADLSDACAGLSDARALVILLQAAHCVSDFLVFLPEMIAEPVFLFHHGTLVLVSLVLPHCQGCVYTVVAFTIAEIGSGAVAYDAEWRKTGGQSDGLGRVVVFGTSRLLNLFLLYEIWRVTPVRHIFRLTDVGDAGEHVEVFAVNVPICMLTSVGGSAMMLAVNGVTWWRMWRAYLRLANKKKKKRA